jgi:hypothetical protein
MSNAETVPTVIVNVNGVTTTVHRKKTVETSKRLPAPSLSGKPKVMTRKQSIVAGVLAIGLPEFKAKELANASDSMDASTLAALRSILNQPDPHHTFRHHLSEKMNPKRWEDTLPRWIRDADAHYHEVDETARSVNETINSLSVTNRVLEGLNRYRNSGIEYSTEQLHDLARIGAAAYAMGFSHADIADKDLIVDDWKSAYLNSPDIIQLATSNRETADRIMHLITDELLLSESRLLFRLEGGTRPLADGAL